MVWLPAASVAVQLTVVSPIAKVVPEVREQTTVASPWLSVASDAKSTMAPAGSVAVAVTSFTVSVGGIVSRTAITNGLSDEVSAHSVPVDASDEIVRSTSAPFSPCSTLSVPNVALSTVDRAKHTVIGGATRAVVEMSKAEKTDKSRPDLELRRDRRSRAGHYRSRSEHCR